MNGEIFDEFDDRFEDDDTWIDDFDDRDEVFDAQAEAKILDDIGIDWTTFDGRRRSDLGLLLDGGGEEDDEIAA